MKRSWIGFGLLLVLLAVSLAVTAVMTRIHEEIEMDLQQSVVCAMEKDWDSTDLFFLRARRNWRKWEHFRACFADHNPVEDIDAAFASLELYRISRDPIVYSAACASLARQVAAVGEAHEPVWWNFL